MISHDLTNCPGCGAAFPQRAGPTHPYMVSSPACWAAYGEILAREYSDPALLPVHRLSVDAYAVQHPGERSRKSIQSVGVHLIRLCLFLEHGLTPERANDAMLAAGKIKHSFTWLEPPSALGSITVRDVMQTQEAAQHAEVVPRWARSAWAAWAPHHPVVQDWLVRSNQACKPIPLRGSAQFRHQVAREMSAPIINHELEPHAQDDSSHPIRSLTAIDVMTVKKGGGADLFVVVASPLMADARSQNRLLAKLRGYLGFIATSEFQAQAGAPTPANTAIVVKLHPGSASEIRRLLARSESWVLSHHATLGVQTLSSRELGIGT